MVKKGGFEIVKIVVLAALVVAPTWAFAQSNSVAKRVDVKRQLSPCLSLSSTDSEDITVEQTAECCGACVSVLTPVTRDATGYWDHLYQYRQSAWITASFVVFLLILGFSWLAIRRFWKLAFWLVPLGLALVGAMSVVWLERQVLAEDEANLIKADRVLRDIAELRMAFTTHGKMPRTCDEAIIQQGNRDNSICAGPLMTYAGLYFPGFGKFDPNVERHAKVEAIKERADDAYNLLRAGEISGKHRPKSVQDVYEVNPIFKKAKADWLGPFNYDWLLPVLVVVSSLVLAVVFGMIKKRVNIYMTRPGTTPDSRK